MEREIPAYRAALAERDRLIPQLQVIDQVRLLTRSQPTFAYMTRKRCGDADQSTVQTVIVHPKAVGSVAPVRRRSGVVLVDDGRVALIRRHRGGRLYHLFPGGGVEAGESDEVAAVREAHEELGVEVEITRLLGTVTFGTSTQVYFEVSATGGEFGTGEGPEMSSPAESDDGSYEPIWLPLDELGAVDVRPAALASMLAAGSLPATPFEIVDG